MSKFAHSYAEQEEKQRFGGWVKSERKPWSIYEMGAVLGGFVVFWPIGLFALYMKHRNGEIWNGASQMQAPWTAWKSPSDAAHKFAGACNSWKRGFANSGNEAFDEYRKEKMAELEAMRKKLDEERSSFDDYLNKLRKAKDREDFERFMAEKNAPKTQA